jgi:hypothetical protein
VGRKGKAQEQARAEQRQRLLNLNCGLVAFDRLLCQIRITDGRIRDETRAITESGDYRAGELADTLMLDTENFYTLADRTLKLVDNFLKPDESKVFRSDERYKTLCAIRSTLVIHAYDKLGGDPSNAFAYRPDLGLALKGGVGVFKDEGYAINYQAFWDLLLRHTILQEMPRSHPRVSDKLVQHFTGKDLI